MESFFLTPLEARLTRHLTQSPEQAVVDLFQSVAADVPAYRDFLEREKIDRSKIGTISDFQRLSLLTKQNYITPYPLPQRCRNGKLSDCEIIAVSSGSTGKPFFWPRSLEDELDIAYRFEQIFRDGFQAKGRSTLAVICFALGSWVGGIYTASCCRYLARKGYPITLVTPGNNRNEIFRVLESLGTYFDQVVLAGYPPFIREVIDHGRAQGIDWKKYRIKLVFAGEVFSEEWRDLVCERSESNDPFHDTASLYGTADAGVLGNETPLSIPIRRFFSQNPDKGARLFGELRLPTLVQYDPLSRFFEATAEGTLVVSANCGTPLIRYHIADKGGVIPHDAMLRFLREEGGDFLEKLESQGARGIYSLPFVYLFGRADFTVSYYGANVYPENISVGLEREPIKNWVTGKFILQVLEGEDEKILSVTVELQPGIAGDEEKEQEIARSIQRALLRLNSEFTHYVPVERQLPGVALRPSGDPEYFPPGVKHRYTRK